MLVLMPDIWGAIHGLFCVTGFFTTVYAGRKPVCYAPVNNLYPLMFLTALCCESALLEQDKKSSTLRAGFDLDVSIMPGSYTITNRKSQTCPLLFGGKERCPNVFHHFGRNPAAVVTHRQD